MFGMASDERTRELLEGAGFALERAEDVHVLFRYPDVDEWVSSARDTGGAFARAWDDASEEERAAISVELKGRFAPFAVDGGYEFPGVTLCVLAS